MVVTAILLFSLCTCRIHSLCHPPGSVGSYLLRILSESDRIPSTTPCAEPPRDARDYGSARGSPTRSLRRYQAKCPLGARDRRFV